MSAVASLLPDGRLHLQHGPIDLVVEAVARGTLPRSTPGVVPRSDREAGASRSTRDARACLETQAAPAPQHDVLEEAVAAAYRAAAARFATILPELCGELALLRMPVRPGSPAPAGAVARRMHAAVLPFAAETFVTPMAAVAGAVAEEVLAAMLALAGAGRLRRIAVNNGGDVAVWLAPGASLRLGLVDRPERPGLFGTATIRAGDGIGGIATSGWPGRSFSRGIADAVTVLAATAAEADAAATVVANAVDLPGHPAVLRVPARAIQCDSDLGDIPVTRGVGRLAPAEIDAALARGRDVAWRLVRRGLIRAAALHLQGVTVVAAHPSFHQPHHAEEVSRPAKPAAGRLEARTDGRACFTTRASGPLLSMTHGVDRSEPRETIR